MDGQISRQKLGDDTTESFTYSDDRLQLTRQKVMRGGATLLDLSYGYGASAGQMGNSTNVGNSGQLVSVSGTINNQNRNQTFSYDNVGRLVTATGWGAWARRYGYDRYGNRTGVWDAVSGGNQLQTALIGQADGAPTNRIASVNGTAFSYDASGNVTNDGARTYTYDAESRVVGVSGVAAESYGYDAANHRVKKEVGGVVMRYIWEGDQVIAEYERGGGSTQAAGTRYYHQDRLSTRLITDSAGNMVGTTDHLPFGEEIGASGEGEKHKFTTYERDGTGLDYAVNRHYASQLGRFNQVDPLGMGAASLAAPQSLNQYSYVGNDPVNQIDPTGLLRPTPEMEEYWRVLQAWMDFLDFYLRSLEFHSSRGGGGEPEPRSGGGGGGGGLQQNKSGRGGSSDRNVPAGTTGGTNSPCATLAANAQRIADAALASRGGNADWSAVEEFDEELSRLYVGTRIDTYQHAIDADRNMNEAGERVAGRLQDENGWGQRDFKDKFQEPSADGVIRPENDQTHHAVAYISAGINNMGIVALGHIMALLHESK